MASPAALHLALDLVRNPRLAGIMQRQPLPPDLLVLIRLAASDPETIAENSSLTGRTPEVLREAAVLYIQRVLWSADADHYRALGAQPGATREQLAEHLRWLMKWIHPDRQQLPQEVAFGRRVLSAWNALKNPDRRKEYDRSLAAKSAIPTRRRLRSRSQRRLPWIDEPADQGSVDGHRMMWGAAGALAAAAALLAWVLTADWWAPVPPPTAAREIAPLGDARAAGSGRPAVDEDVAARGNRIVDQVAGQSD